MLRHGIITKVGYPSMITYVFGVAHFLVFKKESDFNEFLYLLADCRMRAESDHFLAGPVGLITNELQHGATPQSLE